MKTIGVIGGSGLYELENIADVTRISLDTPWGKPSDDVVVGTLGDARLLFIPRHGKGHVLLPSEINYRANIYALKRLGAKWIISVGAVGSMREDIAPGHVVIPDQFYDHTKGRASSFFGEGVVAHVSLADPVCPLLAGLLFEASRRAGAIVHRGGTYICIEGPQFSSRAESNIYRKWGVDVIGMTNCPEVKLAREAELHFASLALCTDYDCWHDTHADVSVDEILDTLAKNTEMSKRILEEVIPMVPDEPEKGCMCEEALSGAIITSRDAISEEAREKLQLIIGRYLK